MSARRFQLRIKSARSTWWSFEDKVGADNSRICQCSPDSNIDKDVVIKACGINWKFHFNILVCCSSPVTEGLYVNGVSLDPDLFSRRKKSNK
jgi:hypothetical protein